MRLRVPLEKRFSIRRGNCVLALCMAVEFEGSKLEIKAGPIRGTSSVATIVAAELAANPNRDVMSTLSKSIATIQLMESIYKGIGFVRLCLIKIVSLEASLTRDLIY